MFSLKNEIMKKILPIISYTGLLLTALPAFFVFAGNLSSETYQKLMIIGAVLWFSTAPFWIDKKIKK